MSAQMRLEPSSDAKTVGLPHMITLASPSRSWLISLKLNKIPSID